jgi:Holliday junction resolvasome RuvABC endonuclease subunit
MNILTNDPSFTAWGWAIIETGSKTPLDTGCIKTAPEQKKRRIRASDDRTRRTKEIVQTLLQLIARYDVKFILSEAPHGSQNAQAAIMIGMVAGITTAIAECLDIPIEFYSEQDSKKTVLGKKAATKEDMIEAIDKLYEVDWTGTKYIDEAVADALAVYHTATKQSELLKMTRINRMR